MPFLPREPSAQADGSVSPKHTPTPSNPATPTAKEQTHHKRTRTQTTTPFWFHHDVTYLKSPHQIKSNFITKIHSLYANFKTGLLVCSHCSLPPNTSVVWCVWPSYCKTRQHDASIRHRKTNCLRHAVTTNNEDLACPAQPILNMGTLKILIPNVYRPHKAACKHIPIPIL